MSRSIVSATAAVPAVVLLTTLAWAQQPAAISMPDQVARAPAFDRHTAPDDDEPAQLPYEVPRQTLIPGTPGMPGGYHVMVNAFGQLQNVGVGGHRISNPNVHSWNGGATYPLLTDDWVMGYGRDAGGWVEGLLMINFEPFTNYSAGIPELGQSGEGLWDAQHSHQLIHQAMVAVHPLAGLDGWHPLRMMQEGRYDLSIFGGQGSATIGPPIFMHRASNPGPTVPRKHHKGENPHETFPGVGAAFRMDDTWFEASAFSALELTPQDSRLYPHVDTPSSFAARVRHTFGDWLEVQVSGERLRNQGGGGVSSPWFFETAGFEHVVLGGTKSGLQLGLFAEATYINVPPSLRGFYGTDSAVTVNAGFHVFGMWMLDGNLRRMEHHHGM